MLSRAAPFHLCFEIHNTILNQCFFEQVILWYWTAWADKNPIKSNIGCAHVQWEHKSMKEDRINWWIIRPSVKISANLWLHRSGTSIVEKQFYIRGKVWRIPAWRIPNRFSLWWGRSLYCRWLTRFSQRPIVFRPFYGLIMRAYRKTISGQNYNPAAGLCGLSPPELSISKK